MAQSSAADAATSAEVDQPRYCPWCGASSPYRPEPHTPLWQRAAEQSGQEAPEVVQETLDTEAFFTGCSKCRRASHVIGHEAGHEVHPG